MPHPAPASPLVVPCGAGAACGYLSRWSFASALAACTPDLSDGVPQAEGGLIPHPPHPLVPPCDAGLYGERVGALSLVLSDKAAAGRALSQLKRIARALYSNPPVHGARIVSEVVGDEAMFEEWKQEMEAMAGRIKVGLFQSVHIGDGRVDQQFDLPAPLLVDSCIQGSMTGQGLLERTEAHPSEPAEFVRHHHARVHGAAECCMPLASGSLCLVVCRPAGDLPSCTGVQNCSS